MTSSLKGISSRHFRFSVFVFVLAALLNDAIRSHAAIIGYRFEGTVGLISPTGVTPFGVQATTGAPATPVTGHFYYDLDSTGNVNGLSSEYQQSIANGFSATINGHVISADSYFVSVADRTGTAFDTFSVVYSSFTGPPPTSPLTVDDTPHTTGRFSVTFNGSSSVFSNKLLPTTLNSASFSIKNGMLTESSSAPGIFFNITTLVAIPEPSGIVLCSGGTFLLFGFKRRRRLHLR